MNNLPENFRYKEFSQIGNLKRKINSFNSRHSSDLAIQESLKWKPGTYDKIKALATKSLFPQWFSKSGGNTISKLRNRNRWVFNSLFDELEGLDKELRFLRYRGCSLSQDEKKVQDEFVKSLEDALNLNHHAIKVELSESPYFKKSDLNSGCTPKATLPNIDDQGRVMYYLKQDNLVDNASIFPADWYLNIIFVLRNVELNIIKEDDIAKEPWGNITVAFSVNLLDLFNFRNLRLNRNIPSAMLHGRAYAFPYYPTRLHPFISSSGGNYDDEIGYTTPSEPGWDWYTYQDGNICLGDFTINVFKSLGSLRLTNTLVLLKMWSETYEIGNTTPLNQINNVIYRPNTSWPVSIKKTISIEREVCMSQLLSENNEAYLSSECSKCDLKPNCKIYDKHVLNREEYDNKYLSYTLKEEDKTKLYELFSPIIGDEGLEDLTSEFKRFASELDGDPKTRWPLMRLSNFPKIPTSLTIRAFPDDDEYIRIMKILRGRDKDLESKEITPKDYWNAFNYAAFQYSFNALMVTYVKLADKTRIDAQEYAIDMLDRYIIDKDPDSILKASNNLINYVNAIKFKTSSYPSVPAYLQVYNEKITLGPTSFEFQYFVNVQGTPIQP